MSYPLSSLNDPKVILDYDGFLAAHPECVQELGDVLVINYNPGASHPHYFMCDTIAIYARPGESLDKLYDRAHKAAPYSRQAIFYGKGVGIDESREDARAVCIDRDFRFRKKYVC